jgi:hypothetical protein
MAAISTPQKTIAALALAYVATYFVWLYLMSSTGEALPWVTYWLTAIVAAAYVAFGVSVASLLRLLGAKHPIWLSRPAAGYIAAGSFLLQSLLIGVLTLLGAWPHSFWFFGLYSALWPG